jgi:hypothetical protein
VLRAQELPTMHGLRHAVTAQSADVRFGSLADIPPPSIDVRFTPKSGH